MSLHHDTSVPSAPRVLIVEDDDHIAMAIEYVLTREGLTHERVSMGAAALPRIRALSPDLVLLDVMLPDVSGHDICRGLREDPALAGVRVLMMTARGSANDRRRAMDEGADAFVTKPFDVKDLRAEVRRLLQI